MQRDVIFARVDEDQEAVARQIDKYDLIAIPVVDAPTCWSESSPTTMRWTSSARSRPRTCWPSAACRATPRPTRKRTGKGRIVEAVRRRIGWLLLLFLAGTITKYVSHFFKWVQLRFPDLVDFIPLMIGTGGNAGSQTVGTIIRGLAWARSSTRMVPRLFREWLTGLLLGMLLGTPRLLLHLGTCMAARPSRP